MLYKCKIFVVAFLVLICLSGCQEASVVSVNDVLESAVAPVSAAEIETVGMYVDVTPSMKGFLKNFNSTESTLYSLCLNKIGLLLTSKYDNILYYRVDTPLWRVNNEDVLEQARNASYYKKSEDFVGRDYTLIGERNGYNSKCLTAALNHGTNEDLFILITDFYESSIGKNANANPFAAQIRALAGLDDGKVFGLIGVKSVFSGIIYDIGPDGKSDNYGLNSLSYRPFYILLRGYPEHVQDFCQSMEAHLEELGAQENDDYEITIFYEQAFWPVDYSSFKECANSFTNSKKKKSLWLDDTVVNVSDAMGQAGDIVLPVYGYRKNTADIFGGILYFTYSIDLTHQEQFHALVKKIGKKTTADFLPGGEKELYILPCPARKLCASCWNEEDKTFEEEKIDAFEVYSLYYDWDTEKLYVALRIVDEQLTQGLWRFQWENIMEKSDIEANPWWKNWHTTSVKDTDYSKTDRLNDYIVPILEKKSGTEQSVLNAVVYLNIIDR